MEKYTYKPSSIEWLGDIPKHWKVDRLKDKTLSIVGGDWGYDTDSAKDGVDIVILRVADLNGIYFSFEDPTIRKIKVGSFNSRKVTNQSLIIEKSGGGEKQLVGRVGYPKHIKFDAICSNFMANLTLDNSVDIDFINYLFSTLYASKLNFPFVQQTTGIQNLNVNYYLTTKAAFPPLEEQTLIAAFLDKSTSKIERIIAIKHQQLEKMESSLKSKVKELVSLGINNQKTKETGIEWFSNIPKTWKIIRLKSVLSKVNSGVTPKGGATAYVEEGIPLIRSQNVKFDGLDLNDVVFIKEATHDKMKNSKVLNGDVLLNITGASIGRSCYVEKINEANVNQHVCILRPFQFITTKYLYYLIFSEIGQSQVFSGFKGSGREGLNFEAIKTFRIPLPPSKKEQNEITDKLDYLIKKSKETRENIEFQIKTLNEYRRCLIHECVTGKKQVSEIYKPIQQEVNI